MRALILKLVLIPISTLNFICAASEADHAKIDTPKLSAECDEILEAKNLPAVVSNSAFLNLAFPENFTEKEYYAQALISKIKWEFKLQRLDSSYEGFLNDDQIAYLKRIGANFDNPQLSNVSATSILNEHLRVVGSWLEKGKILSSEVIFPGELASSGERKVVALGSVTKVVRFEDEKITLLQQMQATVDGFFLLADATYQIHDFGHLNGLLQNWQYMAALRRESRNFLNSAAGERFKKSYETTETPSREVLSIKDRYLFVTESLVLMPLRSRDAKASLLNKMILPAHYTNVEAPLPHLSEIKSALREAFQKDSNSAIDLMNEFIRYYDQNAERLGGATMDIYNAPVKGHMIMGALMYNKYLDMEPITFNLAFLVNALRTHNMRHNPVKSATGALTAQGVTALVEIWSRAEVLALAGAKFNAEQWVRYAFLGAEASGLSEYDAAIELNANGAYPPMTFSSSYCRK